MFLDVMALTTNSNPRSGDGLNRIARIGLLLPDSLLHVSSYWCEQVDICVHSSCALSG